MKKIFVKNLSIYMVLAMIISVLSVFMLQTFNGNRTNTQKSYEKIAMVKEKLDANDVETKELIDVVGENALAKARAFAYMVERDPSILNSSATLEEIRKLLDVDELHVTDDKGVLWWGTVEGYYGFDFSTGDQTAPLLAILDDSTLEIAQEPQPNATEGKLFQYISVPRRDAKGIVQVGITPHVLENVLKKNAIDKVLEDFDFGSNGYIFGINASDHTVAYAKNTELIGMSMTEAGFPESIVNGGKGKIKLDGEQGYYVAEVIGDYIIGTMLPTEEYYSVRTEETIIVSVIMFVIFLALLILIQNLVNRKIVKGVLKIADGLEVISEGDLNTRISVGGNPEFELLSSRINEMVQHIKDNFEDNQILLEKQKEDMENSLTLIRNVKGVCESIDAVSNETLLNAKSILSGAKEQESVMEELGRTMDTLTEKLNNSAEASVEMSSDADQLVDEMMDTKDKIQLLSKSMSEISKTSSEIEKIIEEIDAIASQTNMLSLNASIEAARAGESGRGFAVVASQVGELAFRSTEAAKETSKLIGDSIQAVKAGQDIANQVVEEFLKVVETIEETGKSVGRIASMAEEQVAAVTDAVNNLNRISNVTQKNNAISATSETTSIHLADEAKRLRELVEHS